VERERKRAESERVTHCVRVVGAERERKMEERERVIHCVRVGRGGVGGGGAEKERGRRARAERERATRHARRCTRVFRGRQLKCNDCRPTHTHTHTRTHTRELAGEVRRVLLQHLRVNVQLIVEPDAAAHGLLDDAEHPLGPDHLRVVLEHLCTGCAVVEVVV